MGYFTIFCLKTFSERTKKRLKIVFLKKFFKLLSFNHALYVYYLNIFRKPYNLKDLGFIEQKYSRKILFIFVTILNPYKLKPQFVLLTRYV